MKKKKKMHRARALACRLGIGRGATLGQGYRKVRGVAAAADAGPCFPAALAGSRRVVLKEEAGSRRVPEAAPEAQRPTAP